MNPKISIIIPVYNAEKYIKRCINTIKKQTYDNIEIVCVNDGSTDKSLEILKKLQKYDNRIIIVDQENEGPFAARKNGILKSTGDYILFCDADDLLPNKESCDVLIKKFNENKDVQIIHFGSVKCMHKFIKVEKTSCLTGKVTFEQLKQDYYEDYIGNSKENAISVVLWDKIYKSEIVKRAVCKMDFNLKMGEDLCLNLLVFDDEEFDKILIIKDIFYCYNVGIGISSNSGKEAIINYGQLKKLQMDFCDKWNLCEKAKNYCNLESIYYLLVVVRDLYFNKKESDESIIEFLIESNEYECIKIAKKYFYSRPKDELFDELLFLLNATPDDYLEFVKTGNKKTESKLHRIVKKVLTYVGLRKN